MNTDNHMGRMDKHPVPRFEIVHKPRRAIVLDVVERSFLDDETTLHKTASSEPNPEPWSARFIGANGEEVWRTSEPYVDVRDVERAIALLAEALGSQALFEGVRPSKDVRRPAEVAVVRVEVAP